MLESTLSIALKNLIQKRNLTKRQTDLLNQTFKFLKKGSIIYPGQLKSMLNIEIVEVYRILEGLTEQGLLERNYEIYCSNCHKFKGKILQALTSMNEETACDFCNNTFDPVKDTIMIYRVVAG